MPDHTGRLSESEKNDISQKIQRLWVGSAKNCPICGSNNWVIADHVVAPIPSGGGGIMIGGPSYPMVMLISQPCGYTIMFNAVLLGVIHPGSPSPTKAG
jgi:hypothetical protein